MICWRREEKCRRVPPAMPAWHHQAFLSGQGQIKMGALIKWSEFEWRIQGPDGTRLCFGGRKREIEPVSCCPFGGFSYN